MSETSHDFRIERKIKWRRGSKCGEGLIGIGGVRRVNPHGTWACEWLLDPVATAAPAVIYGEDALHALTLAIQSIDKLIHDAADDGLELWWLEPGDKCSMLRDPSSDP